MPAPYVCVDIIGLALGVLRRLAGELEAVLLALFDAGVAGEETVVAQRLPQVLVHDDEGARDAVRDGAGPGADAAAFDFHLGV